VALPKGREVHDRVARKPGLPRGEESSARSPRQAQTCATRCFRTNRSIPQVTRYMAVLAVATRQEPAEAPGLRARYTPTTEDGALSVPQVLPAQDLFLMIPISRTAGPAGSPGCCT